MKKKRKHTLQAILMLFSLIMLLVVSYIAYLEFKPMVVKAVTIEAGNSMVEVKEFLLEKELKGRYITDINSLNLNMPGIYEIRIKVGNRIVTSNLEVIDRTAPTAEAVNVIALKGEVIKAESFVTNVTDATNVSVTFKNALDTMIPGDHSVAVILKDSSGNQAQMEALLTILDIKSSVQVEAGSIMDVTGADFIDNDKYSISFITDLMQLDISKPTTHEIQVDVDGRILNSYIEVVDTTPPTASALNKTIWSDETVEAINFVADIKDVSGVQFAYKVNPDLTKLGSQNVTIILEDSYGNQTELEAMLTINADTQPPVFDGVRDKSVYEGEGVSYKKGISARDDRDGDTVFKVDSSKVNLNKEGVYEVKYSAVDKAGNKTVTTATVTVLKLVVTEEMLNKLAKDILDDIIKDTMTQKEIAWEIYSYVKSHVAYTGDSDKTDWMKEAFRGIKYGVGDCFTFYAVSEALLTQAGIENMRVTRVGGRTQHFWNLINCGEGYYHFDTCPHKDKFDSFMLTDEQVKEYTKKRGNNYYNFDKTLYPATPVE
ncbi:MAG TPA: immunoglobulin-like domain-containing protein [Mobilitalea sp.]|nr:immunoglobulin-like domain-containing protein [Mobilitalea sp.]